MKTKRQQNSAAVDHPYFSRPNDPLLRAAGRVPAQAGPRLDWRQALGGAFIIGGFVSLVLGYIGISGTKETYDQLTYFLSNGLGGAAAIVVGSTILIIREHVEDREAMRVIDDRLARLETDVPEDSSNGVHSRPAVMARQS